MAKIPIFQDSILYKSVVDEDLNKTIKSVLQNEIQNNPGNILSNQGGYQTKNITNNFICDKLLKESAELILENYKFTKVKFSMQNLWINKNYKGNYNSPHIHQLSNFSGVYYVEVSDEGGKLIFYRGDKSNQMLEIQTLIKDKDFEEEAHISPVVNQLIIFPSHLLHMVSPHFEEKPRISVSFNISIERHG